MGEYRMTKKKRQGFTGLIFVTREVEKGVEREKGKTERKDRGQIPTKKNSNAREPTCSRL